MSSIGGASGGGGSSSEVITTGAKTTRLFYADASTTDYRFYDDSETEFRWHNSNGFFYFKNITGSDQGWLWWGQISTSTGGTSLSNVGSGADALPGPKQNRAVVSAGTSASITNSIDVTGGPNHINVWGNREGSLKLFHVLATPNYDQDQRLILFEYTTWAA